MRENFDKQIKKHSLVEVLRFETIQYTYKNDRRD